MSREQNQQEFAGKSKGSRAHQEASRALSHPTGRPTSLHLAQVSCYFCATNALPHSRSSRQLLKRQPDSDIVYFFISRVVFFFDLAAEIAAAVITRDDAPFSALAVASRQRLRTAQIPTTSDASSPGNAYPFANIYSLTPAYAYTHSHDPSQNGRCRPALQWNYPLQQFRDAAERSVSLDRA
jgi:hypothetical protein